VDPAAVACTLANARRNGLSEAIEGRAGSLLAAARGERFSVVVATLPQLPAPRRIAAPTRYGGRDGLALHRRLAAGISRALAPGGRLFALVTGWAGPEAVGALLAARGLAVRRVARVERAFRPADYDRHAPGLFAYLDAHARRKGGEPAYRRAGAWCHLSVSFLEARTAAAPRSGRARPRDHGGTAPRER